MGYMISPVHRGQGLAKRMCQHSLRVARSLKYQAVQFNMVVATNIAAVKAWQSCGFIIQCTLPKVYQHSALGSVDAHVMFRDLSGLSCDTGDDQWAHIDLVEESNVRVNDAGQLDGSSQKRLRAAA